MTQYTIAQQIRYCTVRIQTDTGTGTGFLFARPITEDSNQLEVVLVTNKHVIDGATTGIMRLILMNDEGEPTTDNLEVAFQPRPGRTDKFESQWYRHPDPDIDVAVLPFTQILLQVTSAGFHAFTAFLSDAMCPTPEQVDAFDAVETVLFVGYPTGLIDTVNHMPVVRQGITATPIAENWSGKPQMLIDASVFPGSSGSPVFSIRQPGGALTSGAVYFGPPIAHFLGIVSAVYLHPVTGDFTFAALQGPVPRVHQAINLGIVYKTEAVVATITACLSDLKNGTLHPRGLYIITSRTAPLNPAS